jgi:O-antigen ligase/polysaccharide polymerase Wzy-like membrane protein
MMRPPPTPAALLTAAGAATLVAGPAVVAFFDGGYFDVARLVAGIVAWTLVLLAALGTPRPLPRTVPGRLAAGGLAALLGLTLLSLAWAPIKGLAYHDAQRLALYLGAFLAAAMLLRGQGAGRGVEPGLAAGALAVVGYGLAERLLPGVVQLERTVTAAGRLTEPLGYWNAFGAVAALGLVLVARLAGDPSRAPGLRCAATAAAAPLGMGLYLSYSRGSVAAALVGLVVLLALARSWSQLRAILPIATAAGGSALLGAMLPELQSLNGDAGARQGQGAAGLAGLLTLAAGAAWWQGWACRREREGRVRTGELAIPGVLRRRSVAAGLAALLVAGTVVTATAGEGSVSSRTPQFGTRGARFVSLGSHRYSYWRVAVRTWAHHPVLGVGSGAWSVEWLRHRRFRDGAQDAHSLYLETAAELGLAGLLALGAFLAGVGWTTHSAWRRDPEATAGWGAVLAAWSAHAGIDWDWEMPAVTLIAIVVAGALVARAEPRREPPLSRGPAPSG